jgi:putative effector of murein hydrolase
MGTFIILSLCVYLGWTIKLTIDEFEKGNKFYIKFINIIIICLLTSLIIITDFVSKENIKYQTMNDYFNGKIEVIQQVDTIRTFKFN